MNKFRKRFYHNPVQFFQDVAHILTNAPRSRGALSFAFRERLMMAVTSVNACRY